MSEYLRVKVDGVEWSLHRYVYTQAHGPIPDGYVVHHVNHVKHDNRLANLQLMTYAEHARHHNQRWPLDKMCEVCGESFVPAPTKRKRAKTCGRPCFRELARRHQLANSGVRKITPELHDQARARVAAGELRSAVARDLGVSRSTMTRVARGL